MLPRAHLVSGRLLREAYQGLTFVEWCFSGLVGNVGLGPHLEQEPEAVQVSPARCQVESCLLLQGALVDGRWVCWGGQPTTLVKEEGTCLSLNHPAPHTRWS